MADPRTILIADDDPVTRSTLSAALQAAGYRVTTAVDAMQAMMTARKTTPAAIVLDIVMPGGTGLGALKNLRASSGTQLIPVIAISASKDATLPKQAQALGAAAFLTKPVNLPELTALLQRILAPPATT